MTTGSVVGRVYEKLTIVASSGNIFLFPDSVGFFNSSRASSIKFSSLNWSLILYLYASSKSDNILHNVGNEVICSGGLKSIFSICRFFIDGSAHHIS